MKDIAIFILGILLIIAGIEIKQLNEINSVQTMQIVETSEKEKLYNLALAKLEHLQKTNQWSHTSDNCDFKCRVKNAGLENLEVSENLYEGDCNINFAFKLWYDSPTHRQVLEKQYSDLVLLGGKKQSNDECYYIYSIIK